MFTLKVWRKTAPFYLKFLFKSTPRQMNAVVDAEGGYTKYIMYLLHGICIIYCNSTTRLKKKAAPYFELMNKTKKLFENFAVKVI